MSANGIDNRANRYVSEASSSGGQQDSQEKRIQEIAANNLPDPDAQEYWLPWPLSLLEDGWRRFQHAYSVAYNPPSLLESILADRKKRFGPFDTDDCECGGSCKECKPLAYKDVYYNSDGLTALHVVAKQGNSELCEWLIKGGFPPDAKSTGGRLAWEIAKENNHHSLSEFLKSQTQSTTGTTIES